MSLFIDIYHGIPLAGEYEEIHFPPEGNYRLWVLFVDDKNGAWFGTFAKGNRAFSRGLVVSNHLAFILAGGKGYFVETNERIVCSTERTYLDDLSDIIEIKGSEFVVGTDGFCLYLFAPGRTVWVSDQFAWDGIELLYVDEWIVKGRYRNVAQDTCYFEFDIQKKIITRLP